MESKPVEFSAPIETTELRYLEPRTLRFFRSGATLRLVLEDDHITVWPDRDGDDGFGGAP